MHEVGKGINEKCIGASAGKNMKLCEALGCKVLCIRLVFVAACMHMFMQVCMRSEAFFRRAFFQRPMRSGPSAHLAAQGIRLARGGDWEESARMSLSNEASPSTLAVPERGKTRRLAAKALAAANDSKADQREA